MKDTYKSNIIQNYITNMNTDEYYIARLRGDSEKTINLDQHALKLLQAYYNGIITEDQIENL